MQGEKSIHVEIIYTQTHFITPPKLIQSRLKFEHLVKDDRFKNPQTPVKSCDGVFLKVWTHLDGEGRREPAAGAFWILESRWARGGWFSRFERAECHASSRGDTKMHLVCKSPSPPPLANTWALAGPVISGNEGNRKAEDKTDCRST